MKCLKIMFALLFGLSTMAVAQAQNPVDSSAFEAVEVYYFHFNSRCETCFMVESEAENNVALLYGSSVSFMAYNLDTEEGEVKGKQLRVPGQSLVIVQGKQVIDITTEAFLYASTNPNKFRAIIKEKIDNLLEL